MAKNVPSSFNELKHRAAEKIKSGDHNVQQDVVDMGNSMLESNVQAKTPIDRVAKRVWKSSGPKDKEMLADKVTNMAKDDANLSD